MCISDSIQIQTILLMLVVSFVYYLKFDLNKKKMKYPPENLCKYCGKFFCCVECRTKHEIKVHFPLFCEEVRCVLCSGEKRIVLKQQNTKAFIEHLFKFHLPLQCGNCSVVFQNKADLIAVHTCLISEKIENEKLNSKMAFASEGKIAPIIEEDVDHDGKVAENNKAHEGSVVVNGSSSINNSDNADQTPPNTLVRQTSTPMTKMLHEIKRHSYESMSASSIQMSSIENCSSEHDISPPVPSTTSNLNLFKLPNRRMPVGATPYRQIMSKSIQRAFNSQGMSRAHCVNATPPLDLRTSPVIRRTISIEGNAKPRPTGVRNYANMMDLRTTPVIRRSRQIESKNLAKAIDARQAGLFRTFNESELENNNNKSDKVSPQESHQKSSLSRSKSTNTFFETCKSFDSSVTSSNQIAETPKSSGLSRRSSSFSNKIQKMSEDQEQWFTPSPENAENVQATHSNKKLSDELANKINDEFPNGTDHNAIKDEAKGMTIWSLFTSVLRYTTGGTTSDNLPSNDNNSLIKRCASFTGILPRKPMINLNDENPYKRRRTTTLSQVESFSQLGDDGNDSGKRTQRIYGRPPINRMRQS